MRAAVRLGAALGAGTEAAAVAHGSESTRLAEGGGRVTAMEVILFGIGVGVGWVIRKNWGRVLKKLDR